MGSSFNVLDFDNSVREYMREQIKQKHPDMDISDNSVFDDIFVKPMISVLKPLVSRVSNIEMKSNLKYAGVLTEDEVEDIGVNNYAVYRRKGDIANAVQTFGFSKVGDDGIVIPEGVVVTDSAGLIFVTTQAMRYSKAEAKRCLNPSSQAYDLTAPIRAGAQGSAYNVGANTITICRTNFNENLAYTTNKLAAVGGADDEPINDYLYRVLRYYANQHLGTEPGYINILQELFPNISDIRIIGKNDEGMERDVVEVVVRDADGSILFDPGEGEFSDRYYARTKKQHIGGCVDIYVRGSEYAVQETAVSVDSNVLSLDNGIEKDSIKIRNVADGSYLTPDDYSVAYLSKGDVGASQNPIYDDKNNPNITCHKCVVDDVFDENRLPETIYDSVVVSSDAAPFSMIEVQGASAGTKFYGVGRTKDDTSGGTFSIDYVADSNITAFSFDFLAGQNSLSGISLHAILDEQNLQEIALDVSPVEIGEDADGNTWYRFSSDTIRLQCSGVRITFDETNTYLTGVLQSATLYAVTEEKSNHLLSVMDALNVSLLTGGDPAYAVTKNLTIPQSPGGFDAAWSTDSPSVLTDLVLGTIDWENLHHTASIKLAAVVSGAENDEKFLVDASYALRIKSPESMNWSLETDSKYASKTLIYIVKQFDTPTTLELTCMIPAASKDDVAQPLTKNYVVGYKSQEVSAPLTGGIVSAHYVQTKEWSESDYADWAEQMHTAFDVDLNAKLEPSDEIAENFSDSLSLSKYNLGATQELLPGSEDPNHQFDHIYIGSSQERAFLDMRPEQGKTGYLHLLPNSSETSNYLSVRTSYNKTLSDINSLLYSQDYHIITTDVMVKESGKTPVNVGLFVRTKGGAAITSLHRSQIYAAIESLFSIAGISGQVEQSDIVGQLYTDTSTSNFVEYVRLPLSAFYIPEDVSAEVEDGRVSGDYIKAGPCESLYLNKVSIISIEEEVSSTISSVSVPSLTFVEGATIVGSKFRGYAFNNEKKPVSGSYLVKSIVGYPDNTTAQAGVLYDINLRFVPDDASCEGADCTGQGLGVTE